MIVCAAVIGQMNNPLYIKCYVDESGESALKFHYIVHCSLDAVEEQVYRSAGKKDQNALKDPYLGLLYPTEDYKVFGYITNTNIKFVLVVDNFAVKEDDIRMVFRLIHTAYVNAVSSSFYSFDTPITSKVFDEKMFSIRNNYTSS